MLVTKDRVLQVPVMSLQTGAQVGETTEPIIDPKNLHIEAFFCQGEGIDFEPAVLHTVDIREFSKLGMIINSSSDIMQPDDLVRLQEIMAYDFNLEGAQVVDEHEQKIGKVVDYTVDIDSYFVVKLHVRPASLLKSLATSEVLIDRNQIVAIVDGRIVVQSTDTSAHQPARRLRAPHLQNPFGSHQPQPEAVKLKEDS